MTHISFKHKFLLVTFTKSIVLLMFTHLLKIFISLDSHKLLSMPLEMIALSMAVAYIAMSEHPNE